LTPSPALLNPINPIINMSPLGRRELPNRRQEVLVTSKMVTRHCKGHRLDARWRAARPSLDDRTILAKAFEFASGATQTSTLVFHYPPATANGESLIDLRWI
jgi:hypothetical protein